MSQELIIRDWHLKKWDKVEFWDSYLVYNWMDWAYAKWNKPDWTYAWPWIFNYLVYDKEKELYIPYKTNKE